MKITLSFLSLIAAALLGAGCRPEPTADPGAAANAFAQSVLIGDVAGAYRESSMNYRTRISFDEFAFRANNLRAVPKSVVTWGEPQEVGEEIVMNGTFPRESGDPGKIVLTLAREISVWKITKFEVE